MSFVLVTADFPDIPDREFEEISTRLEKENWIKMHEHHRYDNTMWFNVNVPDKPEEAIKTARHNFTSCCIPYCIPKLVMEWGSNNKS